MELSSNEEDYLKTIYKLFEQLSEENKNKGVSTNEIAHSIDISAASVSEMLKRLSQKGMVKHVKYQGVSLSQEGMQKAIYIIRKHRLWETFLVNKLKFSWEEVHEIAEQLEHIDSPMLIERLDEFLEFPAYDPHGDPIPNKEGEILKRAKIALKNAPLNKDLKVLAVEENSPLFLKHLNKIKITIGTKIKVLEKIEYDGSLEVEIDAKRQMSLSREVSKNIYVSKI